ncbi:hypothetical protein [Streptomyces achromogenes]|uniref:hypothetical protein n=1 Tax=Streptomyces achromogenes TaxID=67255 RepID=UPI0036FA3DE3
MSSTHHRVVTGLTGDDGGMGFSVCQRAGEPGIDTCYPVGDLDRVIEESQTWWVKTTSPGEIRI